MKYLFVFMIIIQGVFLISFSVDIRISVPAELSFW